MSDITRVVFQGIVAILLLTPFEMQAQETATGRTSEAAVLPGDAIALRVWNEPLMTDTFTVSAGGEVVLPYLGGVQVAGRHPEALSDSLRAAYLAFRSHSSVEVTVLRRIGVLGEVTNPGLYLVDLTLNLRELIANAGGITQQGDPGRVYLIRDGEERVVGAGEVALSTIELQSGDQVVVGRRNWFELNLLGIASTAAVVVSVLVPLVQKVF